MVHAPHHILPPGDMISMHAWLCSATRKCHSMFIAKFSTVAMMFSHHAAVASTCLIPMLLLLSLSMSGFTDNTTCNNTWPACYTFINAYASESILVPVPSFVWKRILLAFIDFAECRFLSLHYAGNHTGRSFKSRDHRTTGCRQRLRANSVNRL